MWWFNCIACIDERNVATPGGGGGNSRPRCQTTKLLTISSPINELKASTFCSGGGSNDDTADDGLDALLLLWWWFWTTELLAFDIGVDAGVWIGVDGEDNGSVLWWSGVAAAEGVPVNPVRKMNVFVVVLFFFFYRIKENFLFCKKKRKKKHIKSKEKRMVGILYIIYVYVKYIDLIIINEINIGLKIKKACVKNNN